MLAVSQEISCVAMAIKLAKKHRQTMAMIGYKATVAVIYSLAVTVMTSLMAGPDKTDLREAQAPTSSMVEGQATGSLKLFTNTMVTPQSGQMQEILEAVQPC